MRWDVVFFLRRSRSLLLSFFSFEPWCFFCCCYSFLCFRCYSCLWFTHCFSLTEMCFGLCVLGGSWSLWRLFYFVDAFLFSFVVVVVVLRGFLSSRRFFIRICSYGGFSLSCHVNEPRYSFMWWLVGLFMIRMFLNVVYFPAWMRFCSVCALARAFFLPMRCINYWRRCQCCDLFDRVCWISDAVDLRDLCALRLGLFLMTPVGNNARLVWRRFVCC